ncbi:MAG: hypothetical protein IJT62_05650 [Oscillospiraceae bacterium]|nr:hypothetical protein [Oscillospiraceae bacterium]
MSKDAITKLRAEEKTGTYDKYANVMKTPVLDQLIHFCEQNEEFAEAVLQGGSFTECMKAVAKNCGSSLSDLEAYKRAAGFYFKGADVVMQLNIRMAGDPEETPKVKPIVLNLEDFL